MREWVMGKLFPELFVLSKLWICMERFNAGLNSARCSGHLNLNSQFFWYLNPCFSGTLSTFNGFWLNHWELLFVPGSMALPFPPLPSLLLSSLLLLSLPLYLSVSLSLSLSLWEICIFLRLHGGRESEKKTSYSNFPYFFKFSFFKKECPEISS